MLAGRAQISVTSNLEASLLIQAHSQLAVVPVSEPRTPTDLAFIVSQEDQVWLNFLNHWITIKQNRGFFEKLKAKLFMSLPGLSTNSYFRGFNRFYAETFRSIPVLVLILWVYYGLPVVLGISLNPFTDHSKSTRFWFWNICFLS